MISSLRGPVLEIRPDSLVIAVGGVGMMVMCAPDTIAQARIGGETTLFTSLVVREDSLTLFGFAAADSRELFDVIQGVSGFGAKLAFTILSSLSADELRIAIGTEDVARLKQTPGVGAKGAQRLVLELKDRIGILPSGNKRTLPAQAQWQEQVEQGLLGLGWTNRDAQRAINAVVDEGVTDPDAISDLLRRALQILAGA
ncbi:MAG: Holliday junction branch migration protein RuvA [Actinomycetes bacterium]